MPPPPKSWFKLIGPGIIAAGVGLASGEFILYPYIASQVGLVFVWAALVGLVTQFFINMEIERYTLATGETALTGFSRFWRHWGLVFALMTFFANLWPGWATSSATMVTYLWGGNANYIAIGMLLTIGAILTLAPVVYVALERIQMVKVAAVLVLFAVAAIVAITADDWADTSQVVTDADIPAAELGFALLLGALAFAGGGGGQNLVQSNWIRDKRFGMGSYVPRIIRPVTGEPEAAPSTGLRLRADPGEPRTVAGVVEVRQPRAAVHLRAHHVRLDLLHLAAGLLDRVRPRGSARRHRLPRGRGQCAQGHRRALVRHVLLGDRRVQPSSPRRSASSTTRVVWSRT